MKPHDEDPEVDPSYGGEDQEHFHDELGVDPAYGGQGSLRAEHHPGEIVVDPAYGGDESPSFLHRAELDEPGDEGTTSDEPPE